MDKRKIHTRKALQQSMVTLILEKGYDAISVSEITDHAELGRATFYLHYKDKDELLAETINEIVRGFINTLTNYPILLLQEGEITNINHVFLFASQHSDLFRVIMRGHGSYKATLQLQTVSAEFIRDGVGKWLKSQRHQLQVPLDILSNFYAGAMLNSIFWWLENDTGYSAEEMAENFKKLVLMGRQQLLGG